MLYCIVTCVLTANMEKALWYVLPIVSQLWQTTAHNDALLSHSLSQFVKHRHILAIIYYSLICGSPTWPGLQSQSGRNLQTQNGCIKSHAWGHRNIHEPVQPKTRALNLRLSRNLRSSADWGVTELQIFRSVSSSLGFLKIWSVPYRFRNIASCMEELCMEDHAGRILDSRMDKLLTMLEDQERGTEDHAGRHCLHSHEVE